MLKLLIADDEPPARNRLRELVHDITHTHIIAEAKNGHEAVSLSAEFQPDIVLLDIRMPSMDGMEAAQHLNKMPTPPAIIFTTAFDRYAIQAFELHAIDYLLKPIRFDRLQMAINKARALRPKQVLALTPLIPQRTHISVIERGRVILIPIEDIVYCRAELKYVTIRTLEREYLLEESLNNLEQTFSNTFIRLHRNCLVATAYILAYEKRAAAAQDLEMTESMHSLANSSDKPSDKQWVAILKGIPETIPVSRRQQHLIRQHP